MGSRIPGASSASSCANGRADPGRAGRRTAAAVRQPRSGNDCSDRVPCKQVACAMFRLRTDRLPSPGPCHGCTPRSTASRPASPSLLAATPRSRRKVHPKRCRPEPVRRNKPSRADAFRRFTSVLHSMTSGWSPNCCARSPTRAIPKRRRSSCRRSRWCSPGATCSVRRRPAPARPPASRCHCCSCCRHGRATATPHVA